MLLIDGDLRRPRLGKLFGLQFATGLSDALLDEGAGNISLDSVIRPSTVPGLYVLPGGSEPANISKLLHSTYLDSSDRAGAVGVRLRAYRLSPYDGYGRCAPVEPQCRWRDTDLSRRRDQSRAIGRSQRALGGDGTPVIGTILNGCDLRIEDPSYVNHYNSYAGVARG